MPNSSTRVFSEEALGLSVRVHVRSELWASRAHVRRRVMRAKHRGPARLISVRYTPAITLTRSSASGLLNSSSSMRGSTAISARRAKTKARGDLRRHDHPYVRHSKPFKNGEQLLAECRQHGLDGIASKRKHSPYKSGKRGWAKAKCAQGKEDNEDRRDLSMPEHMAQVG
jgi:hypothetical protein